MMEVIKKIIGFTMLIILFDAMAFFLAFSHTDSVFDSIKFTLVVDGILAFFGVAMWLVYD